MDIRAHVTFMAQLFLLLIIFLSNQLPLSYDFRIDSDVLLSAFSYAVDNEGNRETVQSWSNCPGYRKPSDASTPTGSHPPRSHNGSDLVSQEPLRSEISGGCGYANGGGRSFRRLLE